MVHYRRNRLPDGTFFFTLTLRDRRSGALVVHIDALRESWTNARRRVPHDIIAASVLPDHLHAVLAMKDGAGDYSRLWQEIKKGFTRRIKPTKSTPWQPRFWEHTIRDQTDLQSHVDYVHINPMKHGLVERVADWPHSTFHRYVRSGLLPSDWAGQSPAMGRYGERP